MMPDDDEPSGYASTADLYWQLGWRGVLPLPLRAKHDPPSIKCAAAKAKRPGHDKRTCEICISYSGYHGVNHSYPDLMAWAEQYPDGNLCLRMPNDDAIAVVGIDVDAYEAKVGGQTLVEAVRRWGPLPPTVRSSSREGDLTSGIRLFRVPPGTRLKTLIHFPDLGIGDIEICQWHHRYVIAWPSIHPDGRIYRWRDQYDQIVDLPRPEEMPWLPERWVEGLRVVPISELDGPIDFDVRKAMTEGQPSTVVHERLRMAIKDLQVSGASRHDTCTRHVMAIARLGKSGQPGVRQALRLLCDVLVAARQVDRSDTPEGTRQEFLRMLTNEGLARELSRPGISDWIDLLALDAAPTTPQLALPAQPPPDAKDPAGRADGVDAIQPSTARSVLEVLEGDFWSARPSLAMIWQTAMAQMASPWATLGICAARALTQVRPHVTLPPIIGGPGSLNLFVALVARSGGGKGAANSAADILIPDAGFASRNLGSGEGLIRLLDKPKGEDGSRETHEALLINVDEIDVLTSLSQRTGSTTSAVLRSVFSGEALGFAYVNRSGLPDIGKHAYRMTMVVSVQPERAAGLLKESGGGLPQRFLWFPAKDRRITADERWPSGPLTLPRPGEWLYPRSIQIPDEARSFIRDQRVKNQQDDEDALDGHAIFAREKFAYALAVLDGRVTMSSEDWELSSIVADVSNHARQFCIDELRGAARIEALDRGEIRGIEMSAADEAKQYEMAERVRGALRWLLKKLAEAGDDGMSTRELTHAANSRRVRPFISEALEVGRSNGLLRLVEGTTQWVRI